MDLDIFLFFREMSRPDTTDEQLIILVFSEHWPSFKLNQYLLFVKIPNNQKTPKYKERKIK